MSVKETTIPALLTASASWTTLVTGGTWTWQSIAAAAPAAGASMRLGLTPEVADALGCYSGGKLELTAVLTFGTSGEAEILTSERQFMRLWLYHDSDYGVIRQARRLAKNLLDRQHAASTDEGYPFLRWVDDLADFVADELGGAMAGGSRYAMRFRRQ